VTKPESRSAATLALFGLGMFLLGHAALVLDPKGSSVAPWWPAAGLAVAALVKRYDRRWSYLPVIVIASGLANVTGGRPVDVAIGFALSNALEAWIVGAVVHAGRRTGPLDRVADVGRFVVGVTLGAVAIGVGAGLTVLVFAGGDFLDVFASVAPSHATAVCLITPIVMTRSRQSERNPFEFAVIWAAVAATTFLVFSSNTFPRLAFLVIPLLLWSVVRLGFRTVTAQLVMVGVASTVLTARAADDSAGYQDWLRPLQLFIITCSVLVTVVGAALVDRERALQRSRASDATYRAGFAESVVAMMLARVEHGRLRLVQVNGAATALFEVRVGDTWGERLATSDGRKVRELVDELESGTGFRREVAETDGDDPRWFNLSANRLVGVEDRGVVSLQIVDTTRRHSAELELEEMALVDQLTGLPNLSAATTALREAIGFARHDGTPLALVALDIDGFASINEVFGHVAGDQVLVELANRLRSIVRETDVVARFGGDRFLLICPNAGSPAGAITLAERVWQVTEAPIQLRDLDYEVSLSVGVAISDESIEADQLLSEADLAVGAAKSAGRRTITLYSAELRERSARRLQTIADVRSAMRNGRYEMFMQPVVNLVSGRTVAAEALIRWRLPDGSLRPPGEWLDIAEQTGMMHELGAWVLDESVRQAAEWLDTVGRDAAPAVHVNVSASQFERQGFADLVESTLRRHRFPAELLVIELTETFLANADGALESEFATLARSGVRLAADDFGTGYSPLTRVIELPIHMIKVDRMFVKDVATDHRAAAVVAALVRMAHELGLDVVAEGIEDEEQRDVLIALGCESAQGYLWSPAVDPDTFRKNVLAPIAKRQLAVAAAAGSSTG
jgi:diguanylate cyclase (GGDEF)-like protein